MGMCVLQVPHGDWVTINVPADDYDPASAVGRYRQL